MHTYHLIAINCRYTHSCLPLFYVRNELKRRLPGCQTILSQFSINDPYYHTLLDISTRESQSLFFSVYIWNAGHVQRLVEDLSQLQPQRPIILGGPQAPFLNNLPPQCVVARGEVEGLDDSFFQDLQALNLQPLYTATPGRTFCSPYRPEDFSGPLANRHLYYESSRGCPFSCSYCLSSVRRGVSHHDLSKVRAELSQILATRPKLIKFVDRTFNDDSSRALAIWQFLASKDETNDLNLSEQLATRTSTAAGRDREQKNLEARAETTKFHFEIAPDRFTQEMFEFLATVPPDLFQFEIGIQSTNPETLVAVNRRMDVDTALENIERLAGLDNIHLHVDLILGLPRDTPETFARSFNQVFHAQPHYIQMGLLKVLPETKISRECEQYGIIHCRRPPYEILANKLLDHQTLADLHELGECVESFYNNRYFRSLWRYLRGKGEEPFAFFSKLLLICRMHGFFKLAATQLLMTRMLFNLARERDDRELLTELLRYDWLRCGHRFLPDFLEPELLTDTRATLRRSLPQELPGFFTSKSRNEFLKRGIFLRMSGQTLAELDLSEDGKDNYVCFLPEQTMGVMKHRKTVLVRWEGDASCNTDQSEL